MCIRDRATSGHGFIEIECQPIDLLEVAAFDEAVARFIDGDLLKHGPALYPFVSIENDLCAKGWIPTHADRDVSPFRVDQMKVVVFDEGPLFTVMQVCDATVGRVTDIPHWRCCIGSDDQEQAAVIGITGQVLFSQFMFAFTGLSFYQRRTVLDVYKRQVICCMALGVVHLLTACALAYRLSQL